MTSHNHHNNGSVQRAIKIYARIKPSLNRQTANYDLINSSTDEEFLTIAIKQNPDDGYINNKPENHSFQFSKIFDRPTTQEQVFQAVAKPVVDSALLGYNGTIFAYGQTGSGKTFTMTGSRVEYDKRGIIPRTLAYVFRQFQEDPDGSKIRAAFVSYLEIYNEGGYDLLHSSDMAGRLEDLGKVTLLEDGHQQMHLRNLSVHPISSEEEALQLLYLGDHNRTVAETPLNESSTRSHCIFTIHLNIREANTSIVRRSKLHLVDLAGSERVSNSTISGQLLTEARHINLALHYLEQVIVALSDTNRQHIPYRNSMMTSVLRDSLGGNCMTSMIATLSLEPRNVMESLSTCRFAQRVAMVTNAAMPNEELDPNLVIQQLKAEVKRLKETIASSSVKPMKENAAPLSQEEYADCCELVDRFLQDIDTKSILPVLPDMRLIQTCFRLMKSAYNMKKVRSAGAINNTSTALCTTKLTTTTTTATPNGPSSRPRTEMTAQELLQTINRRDIEIKVLVEMLRKEKMRRGVGSRESSCVNPSQLELSGLCDSNAPSCSPTPVCQFAQEQLDEMGNSDEESQGMSEVKKLALSEFLETYEGRGKLEEIRTEILRKREEVESLQNTINSNEVNMGSLSDIYNRTKADGLNKDSENLKNALESQERTFLMQAKRMETAKQELDAKHETLKIMYRQLMSEFEEWWQNTAKHKPAEKSKIGNSTIQAVASAFKQPAEVETTKKVSASRLISTMAPVNFQGVYIKEDSPGQGVEDKTVSQSPPLLQNSDSKSSLLSCNNVGPSVPPPSPWSMETDHETSSLDILDDPDSLSVPLTGDPSTDNEILKFFKARKKAAMKIQQAAAAAASGRPF